MKQQMNDRFTANPHSAPKIVPLHSLGDIASTHDSWDPPVPLVLPADDLNSVVLLHSLGDIASTHDPLVMLKADTAMLAADPNPSVILTADTTMLAAGINPSSMLMSMTLHQHLCHPANHHLKPGQLCCFMGGIWHTLMST